MSSDTAPPRRRKSISADLLRTIMNRFLKKKGTPEAGPTANEEALQAFSAPPQPSPASPGLKKSGTRRWMRRKEQPEPKPELNINAALPSQDDFRTSLLMPNLSARFSMLREQDDPTSLLGKASDDSVLQPRRRSRMADLGTFGNLGDIAEVSSITGSSKNSVRPPFAASRQDSFGSEAAASEGDGAEGSIMSRARRGEGNTMFGGRQKVYMIGGANNSSTKSLGKVVYEDDIKMSAFQKYRRQRELEEGRVSDESQGFDFGLDQAGPGDQDDRGARTPSDSAKDLSHSPSLSSYERKRSTASTSHSEARSSTAATSVASQPAATVPSPAVMPTQPPAPVPAMPLKRSDTKTRRLYEQGLDQHMQEQQSSALSRLNSIQRQRTLNNGKQGGPFLHSAKSASNIHETARQPVYAVRSQSPAPVSPLPALTTFQSVGMSSPNLTGSGPQSPTSPQAGHFDEDAFLNSTMDPADRGKATAMGHFDKPKQAFNEQQYLERQRQLQRANSNAAVKKDLSGTSAFQQRMGRFEQDRQRSDSQASNRSRSRSVPKKEPTKAYNVFQRAAGQIGAQPGAQTYDKSNLPDTHRTFFGDISASDSEDEDEQSQQPAAQRSFTPNYQNDYGHGAQSRWQPTPLPSVSEHPAFRGHKAKPSLAEEDELEPAPLRNAPSSRSLKTDTETVKGGRSEQDFDSPTIPNNVQPLTGLMQHLRQRSNQSSIFPGDELPPSDRDIPEVPQWNPQNFDFGNRTARNTVESESRINSTYTSSNPWDLEETDSRISRASISPIDDSRSRDMFTGRAPSRQTGQNRESEVVSPLPVEEEQEPQAPWQKELHARHNRDASTATQQEREAFANELAARRTAIQENMKSRAESQSRGTSPAPSAGGARKALGMLRSRPSRESMDNVPRPGPPGPPKAMKMLGLGGGQGQSGSSNTLNSNYERSLSSFDMARSQKDNYGPPPPMPVNPPRHFEAQRERELSRSRGDSEASAHGRDGVNTTGRSPASSSGGRSRANSEAARGGRSRSRTGPYRDDLDKAMIEGTGSSAAAMSPMLPRELTPRPSPEITQGGFEPNRPRTNSRAGMTNYFDQKNGAPVHPALQKDRLQTAAGPSPISLSPNPYTPGSGAASSGRSPASPFVHSNMTPPLSGNNTPTFTPPPSSQVQSPPTGPSQVIPPTRTGPLRKKTVSKADISEPTLVSYTSNIDTIDLPEGASLKNGMDDVGPPPPVPPINPRRKAVNRMFSIGRKDNSASAEDVRLPSEHSPGAVNFNRSKTPDPWQSRAPEPDFPFDVARGNGHVGVNGGVEGRMRSNSRSPGPQQALSNGFASPSNGSPERVQRSPAPPQLVEGGMF